MSCIISYKVCHDTGLVLGECERERNRREGLRVMRAWSEIS